MKKVLSFVLSLVMLLTTAAALPFHAFADETITEEMITFCQTAFVYDGTPKCPVVIVKDGDAVLEENVHYQVFYRVDAIDVPLMESAPSDAGDYVVIVMGCGSYDGLVEKQFSILEDHPQFGKPTVFGDHTFYVNEESGASSAVIKKDSDGNDQISWLREFSDGTSAWYGFDNTEGALPEGSVVSVKWYGKDTEDDLIRQKLQSVDDQEFVKKLKKDSVMLIEVDAIYNGNNIHEFDQNKIVTMHIEVNDDWASKDIGALYISDGKDEEIPVLPGGILTLGKDMHGVTLRLHHFSTYMLYVKENDSAAPAKSLAKASVTGIKAKTYTGKAVKQKLTVTLDGKTLQKGTDYKVSYLKNTKVGKATVVIKGINNYTGTIKKTFKINPKGTALKKVTAGKKKFTAVWKKQAKQTTGYQIQYSTNRRFKKGVKTITVKNRKKVKTTVKKLKANKKYYVRIRTYKVVGKKKYYSAWSKAKAVKTK